MWAGGSSTERKLQQQLLAARRELGSAGGRSRGIRGRVGRSQPRPFDTQRGGACNQFETEPFRRGGVGEDDHIRAGAEQPAAFHRSIRQRNEFDNATARLRHVDGSPRASAAALAPPTSAAAAG